jgi:hypothetical protein
MQCIPGTENVLKCNGFASPGLLGASKIRTKNGRNNAVWRIKRNRDF